MEYDTTHWPLALLVLPANMKELDLEPLARSLERLFARRERFVSLTDASVVASLPDAKGRSALGAWTKSIEPLSKRWLVANALVVPSPIARGVLTAIQWIAPPVVPTAACASAEDACRHLAEHARREGLDAGALDRYLRARRR